MALSSKFTKTLDLPHEPGTTITIRKLSHHHLMMAIDGRVDRAVDKAARLGETIKHLPDRDPNAPADDDLANKYDLLTVLRFGITGWSYPEPCDDEHKADLDEDTADFLFDEIIGFSVRGAAEGKASASDSPASTDPDGGAGLGS